MNEDLLRALLSDSVEGVQASDALLTKVSAAVGGSYTRRRAVVRGWIAVGGAGLAAAAVLLVMPLVRPTNSALPAPGVGPSVAVTTGSTAVATTGALSSAGSPVGDVGALLGNRPWYVVGVTDRGTSLALDPPTRSDSAMRIQITRGSLQGHDGCNWIGANPALLSSAPSATVGMSVSAMLCDPAPVGQRQFFDALRSGPKSWSFAGDELTLDADGIEVRFSPDASRVPSSAVVLGENLLDALGPRPWYAVKIVANGAPVDLVRPLRREQALQIRVDGADLTAFDGCNQIGANIAVLSSAPPTRVDWSRTDAGCSPIPAGQSEFTAALQDSAKIWSKIDSYLVLTTSRFEVTFGAAPLVPTNSTG